MMKSCRFGSVKRTKLARSCNTDPCDSGTHEVTHEAAMTNIHRGTLRYGVLAVAISVAAACGPFRRTPESERALIYFTNESLEQATLFAFSSASPRVRLGTVFAGRSDTLLVPAQLTRSSTVNLVATLLARSATPSSGPVSIQPGDRLQVRLPADAKSL